MIIVAMSIMAPTLDTTVNELEDDTHTAETALPLAAQGFGDSGCIGLRDLGIEEFEVK